MRSLKAFCMYLDIVAHRLRLHLRPNLAVDVPAHLVQLTLQLGREISDGNFNTCVPNKRHDAQWGLDAGLVDAKSPMA